MKVLVVEDNIDLLRFYAKTLRSIDHTVYQAATIHAASELLSKYTFDVCIFDMELGSYTAVDLLARFPTLQAQGSKVIVISGHERYRDFCEASKIGFYLKPITKQHLLGMTYQIRA